MNFNLRIIRVFGLFLTVALLCVGCSYPAHQYAKQGQVSRLKKSINQGEDINGRNMLGDTPLHVASEHGQLEVVTFLISHHVDITVKNSFKETPLHLSAKKGHIDIAEILVEQGADIHARDNHGNTPLMLAAREGQVLMVKFLIDQKARVDSVNYYQEKASYLASKNGHLKVANLLMNSQRKTTTLDLKDKTSRLTAQSKDITDRTPPVIIISHPESKRGFELVHELERVMIRGYIEDESSIRSLTINGIGVSVSTDLSFQTSVPLEKGKNDLMIVAIDHHNNQSIKKLIVRYKSKNNSMENRADLGQSYALIIGNNDYINLPKLKTAEYDATAIDVMLRAKFGFQTTLLLNASKTSINRAMNQYRKILKGEDQLLIYYAGHGLYDDRVKKAYWLPIDADTDDDTNWIIADTITAGIQRMSARHVLIIADSCYSGTLTRSGDTRLEGNMSSSRFFKKMMHKRSRTLMASGGNEPVADSGINDHSIFAHVLLRALTEIKETQFTAEQLFYRGVKESVAGMSKQVPLYATIRNSGHDGGDFVFIRKPK